MNGVTITFGVIARERIAELERLLGYLREVEGPPEREIVVGLETRDAMEPIETPDEHGVRWIMLPAGRGLAYNRNRVLDAAHGDILVQIDDDCVPGPDWLDALLAPLEDPKVAASSGGVQIPPAGFLGDSISALGFPAGAGAGFQTMFRVNADGTTDNLATGNSAVRTFVLRELGGFDESMTYGGEDTELAYRLTHSGHTIVYAPDALVTHPARTSLSEFTRWFYRRGKAKRQFALRVPIWGYVRHRLGSYVSIVRTHASDPKIVLILPLLLASAVLQQLGFFAEWLRPSGPAQRG